MCYKQESRHDVRKYHHHVLLANVRERLGMRSLHQVWKFPRNKIYSFFVLQAQGSSLGYFSIYGRVTGTGNSTNTLFVLVLSYVVNHLLLDYIYDFSVI